jgi:predicted MFS family arabinose efflux permease
MVIELVAGRMVAGNLGSSLYTWTSVIGIVLGGLAIGNYVGGRLADRFEVRRTLAVLFVLSSGAAFSISVVDNYVGGIRALWMLSWPTRVASQVGLVFFVPSCLLGMVSPWA